MIPYAIQLKFFLNKKLTFFMPETYYPQQLIFHAVLSKFACELRTTLYEFAITTWISHHYPYPYTFFR
jgi:hypothetical protein